MWAAAATSLLQSVCTILWVAGTASQEATSSSICYIGLPLIWAPGKQVPHSKGGVHPVPHGIQQHSSLPA